MDSEGSKEAERGIETLDIITRWRLMPDLNLIENLTAPYRSPAPRRQIPVYLG